MSHILIFHASAGTGHKTAAQALAAAFEKRTRDVDHVLCEDALDYGLSIFKGLYVGSYLELSERAPNLWAYFYEQMGKDERRLRRYVRTLVERAGVADLDDFVHKFSPDVIVCTHFLPLNLLSRQKQKGKLGASLYCVVTDYTAHPVWVNAGVDGYFVAAPHVAEMLVEQGVPKETLHVTGIPVHPAIARPKNADDLRQDYAVRGGTVIILMGSGLRVERVREIVTGLLWCGVRGTLYVVAGRNEEVEEALADLQSSSTLTLRVLGFVDYLDDLVALSDLIITKAGGLIVSEVMARHTPMIVIDPIPGQEEWNADYVVSVGAGIQLRLAKMVPTAVQQLIGAPERLHAIRANAQKAGRPRAAFDVAEHILQALKRR